MRRSVIPNSIRLLAAGGLAVGLLAASAGSAWAANSTGDPNNIVTNSDFASPVAPSGSFTDLAGGSTAIPGWTVGGNSVDLCSNGLFNAPVGDPTSTQTVDLDGVAEGSISQVLNTTTGLTYTGSIELAANVSQATEPKTGTLTVGSTSLPLSFNGTGMTVHTLAWAEIPFSFTATSSTTTLTMASTTPGDGGLLVTDVIVDPVPVVGARLADQWIAAGTVGGAAVAGAAFLLLRRRRQVEV